MKRVSLCLVFLFFAAPIFSSTAASPTKEDQLQQLIEKGANPTGWRADVIRSLMSENPQITMVGELGFELNFSTNVFLSENSQIKVVSFDSLNSSAARMAKRYMDMKFPGRHTLIQGNPLDSVITFCGQNNALCFDVIVIDRCRDSEKAIHDIQSMRALASVQTIIVVDNLASNGISQAWAECISRGYVKELRRYTEDHRGMAIGQYYFQD